MSPRKLASFAIAVLSAAFGACSDQSPSAPDPSPGAVEVRPLAQLVEGEGDISFVPGVDGEVTFTAHVTDAAGAPAQGGLVIFQICVTSGDFGFPTGQPSAACEPGGSGRWMRVGTAVVTAGEASLSFCCVTRPLGVRFMYRGQGSGIRTFTLPAEDYTPPV